MDNVIKDIAILLRHNLKVRNWSVYKLSLHANVSTTTLYKILHLKSKNMIVDTLFKICKGFGLSIFEFLTSLKEKQESE